MSFPNIPDINPCISITLEDAVNLLLTSIALEEVSLSKLMDAETCKIMCVLNDCRRKECVFCDAIEINNSVNDTIQNMIKLQMLLQFKLEKVKDIIPTQSTTTFTSTFTSTTCTRTTTSKSTSTTCTKTTTSKCASSASATGCPSPCRDPSYCISQKKGWGGRLTGKGKGRVENPCDEFNCQPAVLITFVSFGDIKGRAVCYSVEKDGARLDFYASGHSIGQEDPYRGSGKVVLCGKGRIEKKSRYNDTAADNGKFILTICSIEGRPIEFKMEIIADIRPELDHNSGFVKARDGGSTLKLEI